MRFSRPLPSLAAILPALALLALAGCGKREKAAEGKPGMDEALAAVVSGFSGGLIGAEGPVRVTLVHPGADSSQLHKALDRNPFGFEPSLKGTAVWTDERTLEFRPSGPMQRGRKYTAELRLDRILAVPEKLKRFGFDFTVMTQHFERDLGGLEAVDEKDLAVQRLGGLLRLADGEDGAAAEKVLTAFQDGRPLPVRWEHRPDRREHGFQVDSVRRGEDSSRVILRWDGKAIGVDRREADTVDVPSIQVFTVLAAEAATGDGRHVAVRFSDPPQKGQDFRGLIEIADQAALRFQAEGNVVKVYSGNEWTGTRTVKVNPGIRNVFGKPLRNPGSFTVAFEEMKPAVRFVGKGVILPGEGRLTLPFEAVNLRAVTVTVVRVVSGNVPQFLQVNTLQGDQEIHRVGRPVLRKTVALNPSASMRPRWARYALDLTELARKDAQPGTLYRVSLAFRKSQSTYPCGDSAAGGRDGDGLQEAADDLASLASAWDRSGYYGEPEEGEAYDWSEREDPCRPSYYRYLPRPARNFLASDIGLMAKMGRPGRLFVAAADLLTAGPLPETSLEILDFQHRAIASARTDGDGFAEIDLPARPFLLRASKGNQRGYLRLDDQDALQLGQFDVGGQAVQEGLKGHLFGERGVWRPGDSLHLTFILEDRHGRLPAGHPVTFELRNPQGQVVRALTRAAGDGRASGGGFYSFATATDADAPTGDYLAQVKAGPAVFSERLKIETVAPNRLKIKVGFAPRPLTIARPVQGVLDVAWLSGAVARHLEAEVELTLRDAPLDFKAFPGYVFSDPARTFSPETQTLYQGRVDAQGHAAFSERVKVAGQAPGALTAVFRTKVLEAGGGFSLDRWSEPFHPYPAYVGVKLPLNGQGYQALSIDSLHKVKLAVVDPEGRRLGRRRVEVKIFKVGWNWWWNRHESSTHWLQNESRTRVAWDTVDLADGQGEWSFRIKYPDYGQYMLRACDMDAGGDPGKDAGAGGGGKGVTGESHCTGRNFYMEWPYWYGRADREGEGGGAAILALATDKTHYKAGEKVRLTIPSPKGGRALVSIEKGPAVYKRYWVDMQADARQTVHEFQAEPGMAPNAYVYVALVQPHNQTVNDLPIRMYNVIPIHVEDPGTRLKPLVSAEPAVFRPGEKAAVHVGEADGKAMQYVVAVVDEGLLDLTRFRTPDPHSVFYAREALAVRTWDLYDFVAGAYGDRLERLFSIGGDEEGGKAPEGRKGNRFPPMVRFLGPFRLDKGKRARHEFDVPQYVGSVRVMVVAGQDGAYGHADTTAFVRKPLMVLGALPRILSPGESFDLPVSVFAMEKHVREVEVEVGVTGPLAVTGERKRTLRINTPSDELVHFRLESREAVGWAKVVIRARSGREKAEQTIEIKVRNPNARVTDVASALLQPGASWSREFRLPGVAGTNKAVLELSRLPPLDLGRRLDFLIQYPHGCVEQTVSAAFPQLYLDAFMDLPARRKEEAEQNVKAAVRRLRSFQTPGGGFGYWPGDPNPNDWASSYAGHFLIEAEKKGYSIPAGVLDQWKKYQRAFAQSWQARYDYWSPLSQSYRLYTLALAGSPEMGAMNRLKESKRLEAAARWQLGAAYHLAAQPEVAGALVQGAPAVKAYVELNGTFGSDLRDKAMMLDALSLMGRKAEATPLMLEVAADLSKDRWWSTQTTAYALVAMSRYAGRLFDRNASAEYGFRLNGDGKDGRFSAPIHQEPLQFKDGEANTLDLRNQGKGLLYARLITEGIPAPGKDTEASQGLALSITYKDMQGRPLEVSSLEQGRDFLAEVKVRHGGGRGALEQLALTKVFPSGWEIRNTRMDQVASPTGRGNAWFAYQDFRDDRVHTYFNLDPGEEKVYNVYLNAAYLGRFHLPPSRVEAMYDATLNARTRGRPVEVFPGQGRQGDPAAPSRLGARRVPGAPARDGADPGAGRDPGPEGEEGGEHPGSDGSEGYEEGSGPEETGE